MTDTNASAYQRASLSHRLPLRWLKSEGTRLTIVVVLAACAFGLAAAILSLAASDLGPLASAAVAAMAAATAGIVGFLQGSHHGPFPRAVQLQLWKVTDELAQYRAFTRLLRDQGQRITGLTSEAAGTIVTGLTDMDRRLTSLADLIEQDGADIGGKQLVTDLRRIGDPVVEMLGALQFQDVTQQQIAFLSRLSLVLDDHMMQLSKQLGDRRAVDRVGNFKAMFDQALDECVMDGQRDDHHAASDSTVREDAALKVELF